MDLSTMISAVFAIGTLGIIVIALAAVLFLSRKSSQDDAIIQQATPGAVAKVIEVGASSVSRNYGDMSVALRLEVTPAYGQPYETISVWEIQPAQVNQVQVGQSVPIKVDVKNPKIIYPDVPWASQPWRGEFTEDDMEN